LRKERKGSINSPTSWVNTTTNLRTSFKSAKSGKKKTLSKSRLNPKSSRQKLVETRQNLTKQHGRKLFMSHDFKTDEQFRNHFFEDNQKLSVNGTQATKIVKGTKKKSLLNDCIIYEEGGGQISTYRNTKKASLADNLSPHLKKDEKQRLIMSLRYRPRQISQEYFPKDIANFNKKIQPESIATPSNKHMRVKSESKPYKNANSTIFLLKK
jgi:hypothetical protein